MEYCYKRPDSNCGACQERKLELEACEIEYVFECWKCDYLQTKEELTESQLFAFDFYMRERAFPGTHLQVWDYKLSDKQAELLRNNLMLIESRIKQLEAEAVTDSVNRT